jgi:hypothetical protein
MDLEDEILMNPEESQVACGLLTAACQQAWLRLTSNFKVKALC